jgi:transposase
MLTMKQYELIRTAHRVYGKSIRMIAREYGHHRNTVRKALAGMEPDYSNYKTPDSPIMNPVAETVVEWLKQDQLNNKKQRHTSRRIYTRLVEEHHFSGGESTVRRWVRLKKRELGFVKAEAMVPLCPQMGKEAEVDWGTASVIIGGLTRKVKFFCMRSRYSGKSFVRTYPLEKQEMFFDAHIHAFSYFGGVYPVLVYDNLTTAVKRVLKGRSRLQQNSFVSFRSYYTFEARFCNSGKGHEKGGVEGLVGYARRNFMVPIPDVENFEELNAHLIKKCDQHSQKVLPDRPLNKNIQTCFEEEKESLLLLPVAPFDAVVPLSAKVTKYQTVRVDSNWYSVPTSYVGSRLKVHMGCWRVQIFDGTTEITWHSRVFEKGQWSLNPMHYLKLLQKKSGAFEEARPILDWRKRWPQEYEKMLEKLKEKDTQIANAGTIEFISILLLHQKYSSDLVEKAIKAAVQAKSWGLEPVKQLILFEQEDNETIPSLATDQIEGVTDISVSQPDLEIYDNLTSRRTS